MSDLTQFDRQSAARIARVVRAVEGEPQQAKPLSFERVDTPRERKQFRVVTITSDWNKDETKTVTFYNQTATPNTVSATNLLFDVAGPGSPATTKTCVIGKEGTAWYFVNTERDPTEIRIAGFSQPWLQGSQKTITFVDSGSTARAFNQFMTLPNNAGICAVFQDEDDAWQLVEASNECTTGTDAGRLATSDPAKSAAGIIDGDGPQMLFNDQGCCRWLGLVRRQFVTDVKWQNGLVVTKQDFWTFVASDPMDTTIECDNFGGEITGGTLTISHGSGTIQVSGDCQSGKQIDIDITLDTTECEE